MIFCADRRSRGRHGARLKETLRPTQTSRAKETLRMSGGGWNVRMSLISTPMPSTFYPLAHFPEHRRDPRCRMAFSTARETEAWSSLS